MVPSPTKTTILPYTTLFRSGKEIEAIAIRRGHEISLRISSSNLQDLTRDNLEGSDVAIEFSTPHTEIGRATSELQSRLHLVCRLLLEKKKKKKSETKKYYKK